MPVASTSEASAAGGVDPLLASSFAGLEDNNTTIPPDTHGAVGPNHLMVTLKTGVRIQSRTGEVLSTVSLSNFWTAVGPFTTYYGCSASYCRTQTVFDPKVLYDPYASRWIFTASADSHQASSSILLGVSQSSDPTGNWNLYRADADPNDLTWADYPALGFNKDWSVVQANMFPFAGGNLISHIFVFNKTNLYQGGSGLYRLFQSPSGFTQVPATTLDPTAATLYLLEHWFGNSGGNGLLRLSTITGSVGAEVLTLGVAFPSTPNPWTTYAGLNFVPQQGAATGLATFDSRLLGLVYRNGTLWATHHIYLPANGFATRSAVQWWQLSTGGDVLQLGRVDDPTGTYFYGFPSIAVNRNNDVLLGYARFSSTHYPSGGYAFRAGLDPLNALRGDTILKFGEAPYVKLDENGRNRWGDYSATMVDPVNDLDLWTLQEYSAPRSGGYDRWGTWWGRVVPPTLPPLTLSIDDVSVAEGNGATTLATFTVSLSSTSTETVSVRVMTANGSAVASTDYLPLSETLIFPPGMTSQSVSVDILGDTQVEPDETFFVLLENPSNAVLGKSRGVGTIGNDEPPLPALAIDDVEVVEGDAGWAQAIFTLSLSAPSPQPVTVSYVTASGTAFPGSDYVHVLSAATIAPGMTSTNISISVVGENLVEADESFFVNLQNASNAAFHDTQGVAKIRDDDFVITSVEVLGADVRIRFTTVAGRMHRVERAATPDGNGGWSPVPGAENVPGTGGIVPVTDLGGARSAQQFYRVRVLP
jgi:hypothetical protein